MMKFKRFSEITMADAGSDLHIHSNYTDGQDSILDIVKQAEKLKLQTIAITDHIREGSTYFDQYQEEIELIRKNSKLNILIGFEARIKNFKGEIDVNRAVLEKADIKIASVHRFPIGKQLFNPGLFSKEIAQEIELEISLAGIENKAFNILGHPGGMCLMYFNEFPLNYFEEIIAACKKHNIAFELNSEYHQAVYPELKKILKKHDPLISFGSDAHVARDIGKWLILLRRDFINE